MTDESADCWMVTTQEDLDEALAEREKDPLVCIHVQGDAEPSVLAWEHANRSVPKIEGNW